MEFFNYELDNVIQMPRKNTHHLFVDYKLAYDSFLRNRILAAMFEPRNRAQLIRLCRMTSNLCSSFTVSMVLSEPLNTVRGFRQSD